MSKKLSQKRLRIVRLLSILISVGISLIFAELIVRVRSTYLSARTMNDPNLQDTAYEFTSTRHHRLIPGARYRHKQQEFDYIWQNNSLGMRDRERPKIAHSSRIRILFMGDSMVQGYGVPLKKSMTYRLEEELNKSKLGPQYEVYNAGIFGYSPMLESIYLKELMAVIVPDIVVVGFFLGNDVGDDYHYYRQAKVDKNGDPFFSGLSWPWDYRNKLLEGKRRVKSSYSSNGHNQAKFLDIDLASSILKNKFRSIFKYSQLVQLVDSSFSAYREQRSSKQHKEDADRLIRSQKNDIRINLGAANLPSTEKGKRILYWQPSIKYIKDMSNTCEKLRVPMILVVIPDDMDGYREDLFAFSSKQENQKNFSEPYEILDNLGIELSIPVIQLLPDYLALMPEHRKNLFFPIDGHWNTRGNDYVAKSLARRLQVLFKDKIIEIS